MQREAVEQNGGGKVSPPGIGADLAQSRFYREPSAGEPTNGKGNGNGQLKRQLADSIRAEQWNKERDIPITNAIWRASTIVSGQVVVHNALVRGS